MASLLAVPLTLHLVRNDRYQTSWRAPQLEELMEEVNERWAPAQISFTPNILTTPLTTEALRGTFLNASQRADRDGRCGPLRPLCQGALDIFMVDCMTYYDAETRVDYVHYKWAKLGLFSLESPNPGPQLANLLGSLLGAAVGSQDARREARSLAARAARPSLKLPPMELGLVIHQAQQEEHGTNRSAPNVRLLLGMLNFVFGQARIRFRERILDTRVGVEALHDVKGLTRTTNYDPHCLNLFLVSHLVRPGQGEAWPAHKLALLADDASPATLARYMGQLLGLPHQIVPERLMHPDGEGLLLTPAEVYNLRRLARRSPPPPDLFLEDEEFWPEEDETLDQVLEDLEGLVARQSAKAELQQLLHYVQAEAIRRDSGIGHRALNLHTVLVGGPGTGKGTLARLLGRLARATGVLGNGHVVKAPALRLIGGLGAWMDKAREGILLIDDVEPWLPYKDHPDGAHKALLVELARRMQHGSEQTVVVLGGRAKDVELLLRKNPRLAAQFARRLSLPDYTPDELLEMFLRLCAQERFQLAPEAHAKVREALAQGEAGAHQPALLLDQMLERQSQRAPEGLELMTLTADDVPGFRALRSHGSDHEIFSNSSVRVTEPPDGDTLAKVLEELDGLVGLKSVKAKVHGLVNLFRGRRKRVHGLHMVFKGPPGTGKTTVARLMGRIFHCLGLLSHGHTVETDRSGLVAAYIGQTALKVNGTIDRALHGVLFVDEAYALIRDDANRDYGPEAVSVLLKRMDDSRDKLSVIAAGYPEEMQHFLDHNPGLSSRVDHVLDFEDFSPAELLRIFEGFCAQEGYRLEEPAQKELARQLDWLHAQKDQFFGNGRLVRSLFEQAVTRQANRLEGEESDLLLRDDLAEPSAGPLRKPPPEEEGGAHYRISEVPRGDTLEAIARDLDALVGLLPVKKRLRTLMNLARAEQLRREEGTPGVAINLHQVFSGAPGTGKTTVARLMGRIYRVTGLLRRGHTLETDRSGLVSGWRGRTPLRVNTVVDKAIHGVLFIDEAYALVGYHDSDGPHAVSTLMKRMEDQRDELAVVLAGYSQDMEQFLESNPGLRSRFGTPLDFVDYSPEELLAIFDTFCLPGRFTLSEEARKSLLDLLTRHHRRRDRTFGNGRFVRGLFEQMVERQADRLAETPEDLRRFELTDVPELEPRGRQLGLRQTQ